MRVARWISGTFVLATWLACLAHAGAQPLPTEGTYRDDWRCRESIRARLPDLESPDGLGGAACARVAGAWMGAYVEVIEAGEGDQGDDVRVHLVTPRADRVITLNAERQRSRQPPLGWIDSLEVRLAPVDGAPSLVRVSVVSRMGEDYSSAEETNVIVHPRGLRVLWAGPGDFAQSDYFVCSRVRATTLRVRGGVLRVRSRVSHHVAPPDDFDPELYAQLAAECASPSPITVDFPLEAR